MADKEKAKNEATDASKESTAAKTPKPTEITQSSISALGGKLDKFSSDLTEDDQVTLATVFALAAKGFQTFSGSRSCSRDLRIGVGKDSLSVERLSTGSLPKLSETFADAFCPGKASRFSIEGMEVERSMYGAKSVAAQGIAAKSVAARACRGFASKSVAAQALCRGFAAKSVAARACRGFAAKSVAARACRGFAAKSVAAQACRGFASKSVAAQALCRGFAAKSVAARACRGFAAKSVAARGCRGFAAKSVAAF